MRIDLPTCGFKNCRFYFDGNCKSKIEYEKCDYVYFKNYIYYTDNLDKLKGTGIDSNRIAEAVERTKEYQKR